MLTEIDANKRMDEYLHLKRQYEQLRLQHERDEQQHLQQIYKREREFEYKINEIRQQEQKKSEKECQLIREDMTYKLHQIETEKTSEIKKLTEDIQRLEDQISSMSMYFREQYAIQDEEWRKKLNQKQEELKQDRISNQNQIQSQLRILDQKRNQDYEQLQSQLKQDKAELFQVFESQKQNDIQLLIENYDKKITQLQEQSEKQLKDQSIDYENRLKQIQSHLEMEKNNTQLIRRRAQEAKKCYDEELEQLRQENSLIVQKLRNDLQVEKKRFEMMSTEFENFRREAIQKEARTQEDCSAREGVLRHRLQNHITEMYQRQIEIAQTLEKQYMELDQAAQAKYEKLRNQYNELHSQLHDTSQLENRRTSIRRSLPKRIEEPSNSSQNEPQPLQEVPKSGCTSRLKKKIL